ncbi:MAG TPA: MaoC/PaaZ C-terminal domain-containing protein [Propionibacteriaceae bacterium]
MTERVVLDAGPNMAPMLAKSMARGVVRKVSGRRPEKLPDREVVLADVAQSASRLAAYDHVCGFGVRDLVPATWLHVQTFPLQLVLLSAPDSPFSLAGMVHVTNSMTLYRPVSVGERLRLSSSYGPPREHRRGVLIDMVGEAHVGDELVWRGVSAYLVRGETLPGMLPEDQPDGVRLPSDVEIDADAVWGLPANLGRRYAGVSGDINPIHTSALGGKAFGFPRAIIHGMWTHARVLAALEPRLPDTYRMDVRFTKPILLPSSVRFGARHEGDHWTAVVRPRSGEKSYLVARIT